MTGLLNQICCFWTHRHREQAGVARGEGPGGLGEGGGTKKSELAVAQQSQGCQVQHGE